MGANCCIPAKGKALSLGTSTQFSTHRNVSYSPSWSLRWDNRTHIEDAEGESERSPDGDSRHAGRRTKSQIDAEADEVSDSGSALGSSETGCQKVNQEDACTSFSFSSEGGNTKALACAREEPSTSMTCQSVLVEPSSSGGPRHSYFSFKTPHEDNSVPSVCSNDLSHGGSSDGWSMRMFSELVATSQRERYSFDSDSISSNQSKITLSDSHNLSFSSPSGDSCGICSKLLKERCPWSCRKILSSGSRSSSITAVLVCGHVFHAECLENMTAEADKYDPQCPVCGSCEKCGSVVLKSEVRLRSKVSRRAVADICSDDKFLVGCNGAGPSEGSNSGFMRFGKPFLRRHFSLGPRSTGSILMDSMQARRRGFWGRWREQ